MRFSKPEEEGIKTAELVKRAFLIFFSILLILISLTLILFISSSRNELSIIENQEIKNVSTLSKLVIKSFDTAISDVLFLGEITTNYIFKEGNKQILFEQISSFLKNKNHYRKLLLADRSGTILIEFVTENGEIISTKPRESRIIDNPDFKNTLSLGRGHVYVSNFQIEDEIPVIVFGTPVFENHEKRAILFVYYDCKPIFEIFRTTFEQQTGEDRFTRVSRYFIVNEDGYWIKGPKPEDEFGFLYSQRSNKKFGNVYPDAWGKITRDQTGQIFTREGLFTFTTFYPIARAEKASQQRASEFDSVITGAVRSFDYFWKIISFIPRNLCTIQSVARLKEFLLYDSVMLLFFFVVSWIIARTTLKKEYAEKILELLTVTDPLTNLYNRRGFFLLAEQQLKIATRLKQYMALFFIDVDDFKNINDNFGHQEGDIALIKTAEILKSTFRQSDIIGRVGGDEFLALVVQDSPIDVETIIKRINNNFEQASKKNKENYKIEVSIGYALYQPEQQTSIDKLISIADKMMYSNKRQKKKLT